MNAWLYYTLAIGLVAAGSVCWMSNLFSLPGNWALLGVTALFAWLVPHDGPRGVTWNTVWILLALATAGEIIEFAAGGAGAAKRGASRRSIWLSLIGALVGSVGGAIVGLPIAVIGSPIAALLGGAAGAFVGAYVGEIWAKRPGGHSFEVAQGAFVGRLWGTVGKFAVGAVMLGVTAVDALLGC
jgi:uncharacterized protein YqgC (DUF456 family)